MSSLMPPTMWVSLILTINLLKLYATMILCTVLSNAVQVRYHRLQAAFEKGKKYQRVGYVEEYRDEVGPG